MKCMILQAARFFATAAFPAVIISRLIAHSKLYYNFPFTNFDYPNTLPQSTAAFDVVNHIASNTGNPLDDRPQNDTIHYLQKFYNYYAHDDGTCELGYNLNVSGASLAYKFHIYKADDLHAIQFYFTQIGASVANQLFNITVWDDTWRCARKHNPSEDEPGAWLFKYYRRLCYLCYTYGLVTFIPEIIISVLSRLAMLG